MNTPVDTARLRAVRSLGAECLYVLVVVNLIGETNPDSLFTSTWIAACCGYEQHATSRFLHQLMALGYVERVNYRAWRIARQGQELLFDPRNVVPRRFSGSGSSYIESESIDLTTTTTPETLSRDVSAEFVHNLSTALQHWGCDRARAERAVQAALLRGDTPEAIQQTIDALGAYAKTQKSIKARGYFIAARLEDGTPAQEIEPAPPPPDPLMGYGKFLHPQQGDSHDP